MLNGKSKNNGSVFNLSSDYSESQISTVILLTGLSGSGKTSIAENIVSRMRANGTKVLLLDGDTFRREHASDLGFSREDRAVNLLRAGKLARQAADSYSVVLMAFIAPYAEDRERLRRQIEPHQFFEVWLSAPLDICEQRDPKGLYKRVRNNELSSFTGISEAYETPATPDLDLPTHLWHLDRCCEILLDFLRLKTAHSIGTAKNGSCAPTLLGMQDVGL